MKFNVFAVKFRQAPVTSFKHFNIGEERNSHIELKVHNMAGITDRTYKLCTYVV